MDVIKRLQNHNIKPSVQRIAIMSYLMEHRTHPSVDEIYTALAPSIPTLSKTTVYNTLKLLSEQGAAQTLTIDEREQLLDTGGGIKKAAPFFQIIHSSDDMRGAAV